MRVGLRTKLVLLMVVVAFLPLLAALLTIVIGGRDLRNEVFGQTLLTTAKTKATSMQQELEDQLKLLRVVAQQRDVYHTIERMSSSVTDEKAAKLQKQWASLKPNSPSVREYIANEAANELANAVRINEKLSHLVVTDLRGYLIAATQKTPNYIYNDMPWWQKCYNNGKGKILVSNIIDAGESHKFILRLCIPIFDSNRKLIGIAKAEMPARNWLPKMVVKIGDQTGFVKLYSESGDIINFDHDSDGTDDPDAVQTKTDIKNDKAYEAQANKYKEYENPEDVTCEGSWVRTPDTIRASVALSQDCAKTGIDMPKWIVTVYIPLQNLYGPLSGLMLLILICGLVIILLVFLGGYYLIDRIVINRIANLSHGARQVAAGELTHRVDASWTGTRYLGKDEIDELQRDFNHMVKKLEISHSELTEANELKENFIRIAGHELRTPVSYIVGMASLMKNCKDPIRLAKAIDTMGFKAGRLDEIIQAMFKLIPSQELAEGLEYHDVNLSELLNAIQVDMQPWLERRKQTLEISCCDDKLIVQADLHKLKDVIENLTMNAVKFTPNDGTVKILVTRQLGGNVEIKVIDQGPGIPESDQHYIFQPFFSGSDILRHSTGKSGFGKKGMGLGLAIAKHFIDQHNGKISFQTSPEGTTFIISIPIAPIH